MPFWPLLRRPRGKFSWATAAGLTQKRLLSARAVMAVGLPLHLSACPSCPAEPIPYWPSGLASRGSTCTRSTKSALSMLTDAAVGALSALLLERRAL
eukprot:8943704-Alexandrium_andersonii.AAC.1